MTHYCGIGNQPKMSLVSADEQNMVLSLAEGSSIDAATKDHMHSLRIEFIDQDHIVHHWAMYHNGEQTEETVMNLGRFVEEKGQEK